MSDSRSVLPDIARLPGERKLSGVPHARSESVFSDPDIVDALEITDATAGLNSAQRRPVIDRYLGGIMARPEKGATLLSGLEKLATGDILHSNHGGGETRPDDARQGNARFLHATLSDRVEALSLDETGEEDAPVMDASAGYNGAWGMSLLDREVEAAERTDKLAKDPVLRNEVGRLVARDDPNDLAVVEAGVHLFKRFLPQAATPEQSAALFADLAYAIDRRKQEVTGRQATTAVSNRIIAAAGSALAASLPINEEASALLKEYCQFGPANPRVGGFMHAKWLMVESQFQQRRSIAELAQKFSRADRLIEPMLHIGGVDLQDLANGAMEKLYMFRRYGVKPAYFRDGILHGLTDSWVVRDPFEDMAAMQELEDRVAATYESPNIAEFALARSTEIEDIQGEFVFVGVGDDGSRVVHRDLPYHVYFDLGMMRDGELNLQASSGVIPLRREFRAQGAENTYELLRLAQIMRLTDLVVPSTLTRELPQIKEQKSRLGRVWNAARFTRIEKLVLPRLRLVAEDPERVEEELEREVEEAEQEARQLRLHAVEGHVRVLPRGYKASPEARAFAAKLGITLGENETWVKKHERGDESAGVIRSHQAIRRNPRFLP